MAIFNLEIVCIDRQRVYRMQKYLSNHLYIDSKRHLTRKSFYILFVP